MTVDYKTLIGDKGLDYSIKNLCNDSRVPAAGILQEAQQWIYQRLRVQGMLTTATGTLAAAAQTIALPAAWRYPYFLMFTPTAAVVKSTPRYKPLDFVIGNWGYDSAGARLTGRPSYWSTDADNIQFEKVADQAYPYHLVYYGAKADLSPSNLTNFLTDRYLHLLKSVCLHYAYQHLQNDRWTKYWFAEAEKAVNEANVDSDQQLEGMEMEVNITGDGSGGVYGYGNL